jgi:hypothetical protein
MATQAEQGGPWISKVLQHILAKVLVLECTQASVPPVTASKGAFSPG